MIIDFHTHVFPEKIAKKTIDVLAGKAQITPFSDGTVSGLLSVMEKGGIDVSVTLPVLTNPSQFDSVFNYCKGFLSNDFDGRIVPFMGFHPDLENVCDKLSIIKDAGFKGIKIHPDYQNTDFNDPKYVAIIKWATELDLIVLTHAGVDYGYPDQPVRCTPEMVLDVLNQVKNPKLVLAHYGGHLLYDKVYDLIAGKDVYFDTSFILREMDRESFVKILKKHGTDKILFATDSPWSDPKTDAQKLKSFNLGKEIEDKILYKNAQKLLKI